MSKTKNMPRSNFEVITPERAKQYLEHNTQNRPLSDIHVLALVNEMKKNNFHTTGESIKFAESGELLDGQHRLMAIVKSGIKQDMLVIRNLDNEAFKYMDTNKPRTASDVLGIEGFDNPKKLAATAKFAMNFNRGAGGYFDASLGHSRGTFRITNAMISDFVNKNKKQLEESIKYGYCKENNLVNKAVLSGLHYILDKIDDVKADDFCHRLVHGTNLTKSSPIYLLRLRLIADMRSTKKLNPIIKMALICKAWNHYRNNKTVTNITWDSNKEPFPKPI